MQNIHEIQRKEIEALGDNPIEASMRIHRNKLERTSTDALNLLHKDLSTATVDQRVKIYDTTRKHLNVIDGISGGDTTNNIIIIPGELANDYTKEIAAIIQQPIPTENTTLKKINKTISKKEIKYNSIPAKVK